MFKCSWLLSIHFGVRTGTVFYICILVVEEETRIDAYPFGENHQAVLKHVPSNHITKRIKQVQEKHPKLKL